MNHSRWAAWLAVAIPVVVLFGPVLFTDRTFAFRDAAHFYYPLFEWCSREWAAGRVPLWNPQENLGVPALADTSSSLFYPGKLIFALPLDFALRYKLYVIGHVILAAAASYVLARAWQASRFAAAATALAYAGGGGVAFQYSNAVFLVGAAWLPLAALAADRMLARRSWRAAVLLGATLALMILGGDPQMALNTLLVTGLYAVVRSFGKAERDDAAAGSVRLARVKSLMVSLGLVGAAAVVGFLLAAVQVLPSSEATKYSERAAFNRPRNIYEVAHVCFSPDAAPQPPGETKSRSIALGLFGPPEAGHPTLAYDFSVGPWRLAEYFWPNIGGRMFPTNRRWFSLIPAETRTWTPTLYLGLLPVLLGLSCFRLRSGSARQKWLSWLVLIFSLASMGLYGIGWIVREIYAASGGDLAKFPVGSQVGGVYWLMVTLLPSYAYFRYPAKLLPLVSLGLSQLAAMGWDRAFAERRPGLLRVLFALGALSGAAAFVVWCGGGWLLIRGAKADLSQGPFDSLGAYRDILAALVHTAIVSWAGYWLLNKTHSETAKRPQWELAALLLTAVELAVANYWVVPTVPAEALRQPPAMARAIDSADQGSAARDPQVPLRVYRDGLGKWRPLSFRQKASLNRVAENVQWERDTLFPKYQLDSDLALVESYGSIKLVDYETLFFIARQYGSLHADKSRLPQPTALRLLGTEYLVLPNTSAPAFAERVELGELPADWPEDASLWHMKRTLPRAWIVHEVEVLAPLPFPLRVAAVDERTKEVLFPGGQARDFSRQAVVETTDSLPRSTNASAGSPIAESCRITTYEPTHVVVEAKLSQPGLVVLSDAWFPGWEATVQTPSEPAPHVATIHRTNRVLRGVWLPAGQHRIEMQYRPASFFRGAVISGASWAALVVLAVVRLTLRRRGREGRSEDKERT